MGDVIDDPQRIEGSVPHDSVDTGDPVKIGGRARTGNPVAVADDDRVDAWFDEFGRIGVFVGNAKPATPSFKILTTTTQQELIAAPGASKATHVLLLTATNSSNSKLRLDIKDGTTVLFSFSMAKEGGGFVLPIPSPGWKLTDNTALNVQLDTTPASGDVRVTAVHYTLP